MTADEPPRFSAEEVIQVASKLTIDDGTFVVGGQATNLWAWFYRPREPRLQTPSLLTSRDIDYFGTRKAARAFGTAKLAPCRDGGAYLGAGVAPHQRGSRACRMG